MKYNFSAGPSILPESVIERASRAVVDFNDSGLSILEISHRSSDFIAVMDKAEENVRTLLNLTDDFAVLFLSGGASTQFFMTAQNLLSPSDKASYLDTGSWSSKAIKEAKLFGTIDVVASSSDRNYSYIPKSYKIDSRSKYLHLTTNNTIYGTQLKEFPDVPVPLVCDMSSDIFSRPVPIDKMGLIYAGAQKNMGPAGTTVVILRKDLIGRTSNKLPSMVNYTTHIEKGSMFNTPPVFPIYVSMLTTSWMLDNGGVEQMEVANRKKADLLYAEIDANPCFAGTVDVPDRSHMNVCFSTTDDRYETLFLEICTKEGIVGIKGHRSVGGFRASLYNAQSDKNVGFLVEVMREFARKIG